MSRDSLNAQITVETDASRVYHTNFSLFNTSRARCALRKKKWTRQKTVAVNDFYLDENDSSLLFVNKREKPKNLQYFLCCKYKFFNNNSLRWRAANWSNRIDFDTLVDSFILERNLPLTLYFLSCRLRSISILGFVFLPFDNRIIVKRRRCSVKAILGK